MAKPKGLLALVRWRDAHAWMDAPDHMPKEYIVKTVGWVRLQGKFYTVVSENTPDGARSVTRIPVQMVVSITALAPKFD